VGGWQRVIGSNRVFRDNKADISTYCIFDSDYHTVEEKQERLADAKTHGLNLHIWQRKEIENYLIVPAAIYRLVKIKKKNAVVTEEGVKTFIDEQCESWKDDVIDSFATEIKAKDNSKTIKTANQEARRYVNGKWSDEKLYLISGKQLISSLCKWLSESFNVSINRFEIAREMALNEIAPEVVQVITCIENRAEF
jgi:hypothetical protein